MGMESLVLFNHDCFVNATAAHHKLGADIYAACVATNWNLKEFRGGKVIYTDNASSHRIIVVGDHLFEVLAADYAPTSNVKETDVQLDLLRAAAAKLGYKLVRLTTAKAKKTKSPDRSKKKDATKGATPRASRSRKQPR
jgi:hypothetical protein